MIQYRWSNRGPLFLVGVLVLLVWALCLMDLSTDGVRAVYSGHPVLRILVVVSRDCLLWFFAYPLAYALRADATLSEHGISVTGRSVPEISWAEMTRIHAGSVDYGNGKEYELVLDEQKMDKHMRLPVPLTADDDHWAVFRRFVSDLAARAGANGAELSPTVRAFQAGEPTAWDEGRRSVRSDLARPFGPVMFLLFSPLLPLGCGVVIALCSALGGPLLGWRLVQFIAAVACAAASASALLIGVRRNRWFGPALAVAFVLWAACLSLWAMPSGWDSGITRVELLPPLLLAALWPLGRFLFAQRQDVRAFFSR